MQFAMIDKLKCPYQAQSCSRCYKQPHFWFRQIILSESDQAGYLTIHNTEQHCKLEIYFNSRNLPTLTFRSKKDVLITLSAEKKEDVLEVLLSTNLSDISHRLCNLSSKFFWALEVKQVYSITTCHNIAMGVFKCLCFANSLTSDIWKVRSLRVDWEWWWREQVPPTVD